MSFARVNATYPSLRSSSRSPSLQAAANSLSPRLVRSRMSGSVAPSPRSGHGSVRALVVHFARPRSLGNTVAARAGTKTTGHSRPFARCAVSSFTESASLGTARSSPAAYSSSAAR